LNIVKEHSQHTIGVEFASRTINVGDKRIKLQVNIGPLFNCIFQDDIGILLTCFLYEQLWDTAGQERFRWVACCTESVLMEYYTDPSLEVITGEQQALC
jgi:GTPase SAR1 family protein